MPTDDLNTAISNARAAVAQKLSYTVTLAEGTVDKANWTIDPTQAKIGTEVKATYSGRLKVKSVEAKLKYPMAAEATAKDKGKLICAAGHIHAYGEDADCTAARVARIFYVGSETGNETYYHGLALALTDEDGAMTWAAAQTACTEKTAVSGASWTLATEAQWGKMTGTAENGYAILRNGFSSIDGTDMQSASYWSSTPQDANNAKFCNFANGTWSDDAKGNSHRVRACLAF